MKKNLLLLSVFFFSFSIFSLAQTKLFVDSSIATSGNGKSWTEAFKTLSEALNKANAGKGFYTISVAKGTYIQQKNQG